MLSSVSHDYDPAGSDKESQKLHRELVMMRASLQKQEDFHKQGVHAYLRQVPASAHLRSAAQCANRVLKLVSPWAHIMG
jgi:hypothetical protein